MDELAPEILAHVFSFSPDLRLVYGHVCHAFLDGVRWQGRQTDREFFDLALDRYPHMAEWALAKGYRVQKMDTFLQKIAADENRMRMYAPYISEEQKAAACAFWMERGDVSAYRRARKRGWPRDIKSCQIVYIKRQLDRLQEHAVELAQLDDREYERAMPARVNAHFDLMAHVFLDEEFRSVVLEPHRKFQKTIRAKLTEFLESEHFSIGQRKCLERYAKTLDQLKEKRKRRIDD